MKEFDPQQPEWDPKKIGWVVFAVLLLFLILMLTQVPRMALWIVMGAAIAVSARLLVGRRML